MRIGLQMRGGLQKMEKVMDALIMGVQLVVTRPDQRLSRQLVSGQFLKEVLSKGKKISRGIKCFKQRRRSRRGRSRIGRSRRGRNERGRRVRFGMKGDASVIVKANKGSSRGVIVAIAQERAIGSEFNTKLVGQGSVEPVGQTNASTTRAGMSIEFYP
jgi:hypothetical protein